MIERHAGVTRVVLLVGRYALKIPRLSTGCGVRGWLANQSEWRQRHRRDVAPVYVTLFHLVLVMPRADEVGRVPGLDEEPDPGPWMDRMGDDLWAAGDDIKPSSWGRFGSIWLLIDFDRYWETGGLVSRLYVRRQDALARHWSRLTPPTTPEKRPEPQKALQAAQGAR